MWPVGRPVKGWPGIDGVDVCSWAYRYAARRLVSLGVGFPRDRAAAVARSERFRVRSVLGIVARSGVRNVSFGRCRAHRGGCRVALLPEGWE